MEKDDLLKILEGDDLGLLAVKAKNSNTLTADERLVSSFAEITNFVKEHGRPPEASPTNMKEFKLHSRLAALRKNYSKAESLQEYDELSLLPLEAPESYLIDPVLEIEVQAPVPTYEEPKPIMSIDDIFDDDDLGLLDDGPESIFKLRNVPAAMTMPEKIAQRKPCKDFANFEHLFLQCHSELTAGIREMRSFTGEQQIKEGHFFVLHGVMVYVAEVGEKERVNGKVNARLRCIFENETESNMLLRSLATELYKDESGRRILDHHDKALEELDFIKQDDQETGFIYILSSLSPDIEIRSIKDLFKIGFSTLAVEERIKNATQEPTYLMAEVKIVTAFRCYNLNTQKLEFMLHAFFGNSCLDIDVFDKTGKRHSPREWFIAPLNIIEAAIQLVINGEIVHYKFDAQTSEIVQR